MVAFESMTSFARVHLCSRENAFHRETVEARVLSQNRTIPSAVAKQDNSESEMVSYALPYRKAGIAVMVRNVQFCGARCMSAVAVWTVSEALSGLPPLICIGSQYSCYV